MTELSLGRCFKPDTPRYLSQELVQVSHLLATVASERRDQGLTVKLRVRRRDLREGGRCPYFAQTFGPRPFRLDIQGWNMTPELEEEEELAEGVETFEQVRDSTQNMSFRNFKVRQKTLRKRKRSSRILLP